MRSTIEAIMQSFEIISDDETSIDYFSHKFGDGFEICVEPLLFGNFYIALYKDGEAIIEKIPVRPTLK